MSEQKRHSPHTRAVHAGAPRHFPYDSLTAPIVQTATYTFADTAELVAYMEGRKDREEYGRYGNPSVSLVEERVAKLENAQDAIVFSSGMAAVTSAVFALAHAGSHVVLFADCYRRTRQFVTAFLERFGVEHSLVEPGDMDALERALRPETRLVISELPTNPYLNVVDLERLAQLCRPKRIRTLIDATFATPINLNPTDYGIDLVMHSATKYLAGHNDVLAGVVAGKSGLISLIRDVRHVLGGVCDPHAAYLVERGLKTLAVRVEQQNRAAMALAEAVEGHPKVQRVWYPGLPSHPHHETAKRLMTGYGGVVSLELKADLERTGRFVDALQIPRIAPSLGGVEALVEQVALMSYFELSTQQRQAIGISDSLVRYSAGIEDPQDIIDDVLQALEYL